jgi:Circularly permutated YpsA SLOG family
VKIVSGGQTGVDRAALDVALKHGIECDGWCPAGRLDEVGPIPDRYPVKELEDGSFAERTLQNVNDSDGTVIVYFEELCGGTKFTLQCCRELKRPHKLIDAAKKSPKAAAESIVDFVRKQKIDILNVAGPRQSEWPGGYDYVFRVLESFLASHNHRPVGRQKSDGSQSCG